MDMDTKNNKENIITSVKTYWEESDSKFKKNVVMCAIVLVVAIGAFIYLQTRSSYEFLLNTSDSTVSANVLSKLREQGVKYEVRGQSIYVSGVNVDEIKLDLSGEGLLSSEDSTIDFTETKFYTDSQQKTLIKKDLENTLRNTIKNYNEVKNASVIITLGEESAFKNNNTPSKAAIQLDLNSTLNSKQIKSIQALVAAAVPNLTEDGVVITDKNNNLLSSNNSDGFDTETNESYKLSLENKVSESIKELLAVAFPGQNYKVVTTMDINFDQIKIQNETVQSGPDTIISQTTSSEKVITDVNNGQVGTESNVPDYNTPDGSGNVVSEKKSETTNYETNKVTEQIVKSPEVKRLSVSVIVDKALTEEEKNVISELISTAALVDLNRGDVVSVAGVAAAPTGENEKTSFIDKFGGIINTGVDRLPLILLSIFIFIITLKLISLFKTKKTVVEEVVYSNEEASDESPINNNSVENAPGVDTSHLFLSPQQVKVREFVKNEMEENPQKVASILQMIKNDEM